VCTHNTYHNPITVRDNREPTYVMLFVGWLVYIWEAVELDIVLHRCVSYVVSVEVYMFGVI
jgi:hypothetical protein